MPLVDFKPNTDEAFADLLCRFKQLRPRIKGIAHRTLGTPENDVIVNLHRCTVADVGPLAADAVVYIETTPGHDKEGKANSFRDAVAEYLLGVAFEHISTIEVWVRFVIGAWCVLSIKDGRIVASTDHTI